MLARRKPGRLQLSMTIKYYFHSLFMNPSDANDQAPNFLPQRSNTTNIYDMLQEIKKEITLSMVEEQLNHFKIKKMIEEECKDSLTW